MNRREALIGAGVAIAATSPGIAWSRGMLAAPPALVTIALRIYIPSPAVTYAPPLLSARTFNGGAKANLEAAIDLNASGAAAHNRTKREFGGTKEYANSDSVTVVGKPDWYRTLKPGSTAIGEGIAPVTDSSINATWSSASGAAHGSKLEVVGKNPLVTAAPAIDAEITVGLRRTANGAIEYWMKGGHDAFPSYELKINGKIVHAHDCSVGGHTPWDLDIGMEIEIDSGWTRL